MQNAMVLGGGIWLLGKKMKTEDVGKKIKEGKRGKGKRRKTA